LWRNRTGFAETNTEILLVSFESLERIQWYLEGADFQWPVLSDPARELYKAYSMERASFARAWLSPRTLSYYARAMLRGQRPHKPAADSLQLGGDVLVDRAGIVRLIHRSREPADRPSVEVLMRSTIAPGSSRAGEGDSEEAQ
jgi:hypothetical protein